MTVFRTGALLALVVLIVIGSGGPALAVEVSRHPDRCHILASTGKSEAGRDRESHSTCARVDNRTSPQVSQHAKKKHERPIDRLLSRGEGKPKATGDKGARREFHRNLHSRHHHSRR